MGAGIVGLRGLRLPRVLTGGVSIVLGDGEIFIPHSLPFKALAMPTRTRLDTS